MAIDPKLMEILVCPACGGSVSVREREAGIVCASCGRVYPIRDGIPVMLVDEATAPSSAESGT